METLSYEERARRLEDAKHEVWKIEQKTRSYLKSETWELIAQDQKIFREMFERLGFPSGYMTAIENKYWPKAYEISQTPWYEYHCQLGVITIGWRKRVISIHWPSTDGSPCKIEVPDQVTHLYEKGEGIIHAWDVVKAEEYLGLILKALKAKDV